MVDGLTLTCCQSIICGSNLISFFILVKFRKHFSRNVKWLFKSFSKEFSCWAFFCLFNKWCTESNPPPKVQQKTVFAAHFFVCIDLKKIKIKRPCFCHQDLSQDEECAQDILFFRWNYIATKICWLLNINNICMSVCWVDVSCSVKCSLCVLCASVYSNMAESAQRKTT